MSISTIVISEDSHTVELLKLYLDEFGEFSFLAGTSDFVKAYDAVNELQKALIIVDISAYQEQGLNFISKIVAEFPECKAIALCDKPDVDLVIRAMRVGASDFLAMPLIKTKFFEVLDKALADINNKKPKK